MARKKKAVQKKAHSPQCSTTGDSESAPPASSSTFKAPRATFTAADDARFVQVLKEQQAAGNQADNNWKGCVWTAVAAELNKEIEDGGPKTAHGCKDHWQKMKTNFALVKLIREKSGAEWNSVQNIGDIPDDAWDDLILKAPDVKNWRYKPFPLYDDIAELVLGRQATGEGALSISSSQQDMLDQSSVLRPPAILSVDTELNNEQSATQASSAPRTPVRGKKRAVSNSPSENRLRKKKSRPSGPSAVLDVAVLDVAGAIRGLTETLTSDTCMPNTPMRLTAAVQKVAVDDSLTKGQRARLLKLFSDNISLADIYSACPDNEIRTLLVHQALGLSSPTLDASVDNSL